MIIVRAPYRISFLGGSTDYIPFIREHTSLVIGTSINKYSYILTRKLPPLFDFKSKISYSKIEEVKYHSQIQHKVIKAILEYYKVVEGVEFSHHADLPSKSGIGSSSSFLAAGVKAVSTLKGQNISKDSIYRASVDIEQNYLKENIGLQDAAWASYGGFGAMAWTNPSDIPTITDFKETEFAKELERSLLFFYSGLQRVSHEIAEAYVSKSSTNQQLAILHMAQEGLSVIESGDIDKFGKLLNESWLQKRSIANNISNERLDEAYEAALDAGASGFKVCGAGAGGCIAVIAHPRYHTNIINHLRGFTRIPVCFDKEGVKLIYE